MHFCHITNQSGQLFPVKELSELCRSRGIISIVDGAHALGPSPSNCATSAWTTTACRCTKWLLAPMGTGMLCVRKERIASTWPLQAAPAATTPTSASSRRSAHIRWGRRPPSTRHSRSTRPSASSGRRRASAAQALRWANALKDVPDYPLQSGGRPDVGPRRGLDRRGHEQTRDAPVGQIRMSSRRSGTTIPTTRSSHTARCASRQTSIRRSRRSTRSSRPCGRWRKTDSPRRMPIAPPRRRLEE